MSTPQTIKGCQFLWVIRNESEINENKWDKTTKINVQCTLNTDDKMPDLQICCLSAVCLAGHTTVYCFIYSCPAYWSLNHTMSATLHSVPAWLTLHWHYNTTPDDTVKNFGTFFLLYYVFVYR